MMNRRAALKSLAALAGVALVGPVPPPARLPTFTSRDALTRPGRGIRVTTELLEDSAIDLTPFRVLAYNSEFDYWDMVIR